VGAKLPGDIGPQADAGFSASSFEDVGIVDAGVSGISFFTVFAIVESSRHPRLHCASV
jgi:hypothetical protein